MGTSNLVHSSARPPRVLKRQKRVIAPDYPFYIVSMSACTCGCNGYFVSVHKQDIGYTKNILDLEFSTPLESFIKFEKLVEECQAGKYDMITPKEGEAFE